MSVYNHNPNDPPCPSGSTAYTVKTGDTLYGIAQRLGTTVAAITDLNPGINPNVLRVGQLICIPSAAPAPAPGACLGGTGYRVKAGDTFYALAARFGVTAQALITANPGVNPDRLAVGQTICIPGPGATPPTPALITTPLCSLLRPVLTALPADADIPIGSVTVRQVAMSTRAYTIVASPLPNPSAFGNYDAYAGVLNLITDDPATPRQTVAIRLASSAYGNQLITWAGTTITAYPPIVGDSAAILPLNSSTGSQGAALLQGDLVSCQPGG